MHILVISQFFVPEYTAGALRTHHNCRRWVECGATVTVVTTVPNFPDGQPFPPYRNRLWQREIIDGIEVIRVWSLLAENRGTVRRSLSFLCFALTGFLAGLALRPDVIVATSPQMLVGLSASWLSRLKRRPWVFEVRDLWPDAILAIGRMHESLLLRFLRQLERRLYDSAARVVAVTRGLQETIAGRTDRPGKVALVYNAADTKLFHPLPPAPDGGIFRVGYVGTIGFTQGLDVLLRCATLLRQERVELRLTGAGGYRAEFLAKVTALGLTNIVILEPVPFEAAPARIAENHASLIVLRDDPLFLSAIPSKLFATAAVGQPIIASLSGEAADLISQYGAGLVAPPGDAAALAGIIRRMRDERELRDRSRQGALTLARDFQRDRMADLFLRILEDVVPPSARADR